jgi:hypothetical protein
METVGKKGTDQKMNNYRSFTKDFFRPFWFRLVRVVDSQKIATAIDFI